MAETIINLINDFLMTDIKMDIHFIRRSIGDMNTLIISKKELIGINRLKRQRTGTQMDRRMIHTCIINGRENHRISTIIQI